MSWSVLIRYLPIFVISLALIILTWEHLYLPFHWDEAWVYGPAAREMNEHGISLLPGTITEEYTRGHPLLFLFLTSSWIRVTGDTLFNLHLFALLISLLLLFVFYSYILKRDNWIIASSITIILASQPLFLGQSSLVFPEMLLALLAFLCFVSILNNKPIALMVFGSLMVLTKEPGLVILFAMFIWQTFCKSVIDKDHLLSKSFLKDVLLPFSVPVLVAISFFAAQYFISGYVLYPAHLGLMKPDYTAAYDTFTQIINFLLDDQYRKYLLLGMVAFLLIPNKKKIPWAMLACIALFFVFTKLLYAYWYTPHYIRLPFLLLLLSGLLYVLVIKNFNNYSITIRKLIAGSFIIILLYTVFSCFNFYTERYMTACLPLLFLLVFGLLDNFKWKQILFPVMAGVAILLSVLFHQSYERDGEDSLNYANRVNTQQQLTAYCIKNVPKDATIYTSFLFMYTLGNHQSGFVTKDQSYHNLGRPKVASPDYYISSNFEKIDLNHDYPFHEKYELSARFKQGFTVIELYKRQSKSH